MTISPGSTLGHFEARSQGSRDARQISELPLTTVSLVDTAADTRATPARYSNTPSDTRVPPRVPLPAPRLADRIALRHPLKCLTRRNPSRLVINLHNEITEQSLISSPTSGGAARAITPIPRSAVGLSLGLGQWTASSSPPY
jgi:hypothetical protein